MNNKYYKNNETYRDKDFFDKLWKDEKKHKKEMGKKNHENELNNKKIEHSKA